MTARPALVELLRQLQDAEYRFTAITPASHARVVARPASARPDLRDIFGWNRQFDPGDVSPAMLELLRAADALDQREGRLRSRLRVANVGRDLVLHSAFPTDDADAVFLGPDTYRFVRFVEENLAGLEGTWLVDMGAGSGAGAIAVLRVKAFARASMVDVNPTALELAAANAAAAGVPAETILAGAVPPGADLVIANPPYLMDDAGRAYRDGGGLMGGAIALDWSRQAIAGMAPGGTMLLYTGVAVVEGRAPLLDALDALCAGSGASLEMTEVDPDLFGEELDKPQYAKVERIAAVGVRMTKAR